MKYKYKVPKWLIRWAKKIGYREIDRMNRKK
jgi:hypothetical protein